MADNAKWKSILYYVYYLNEPLQLDTVFPHYVMLSQMVMNFRHEFLIMSTLPFQSEKLISECTSDKLAEIDVHLDITAYRWLDRELW